ncbi:MAG: hypothetical protein Q8O75_03910 [bacterium]|nr:hypothetical protein [bacterium]
MYSKWDFYNPSKVLTAKDASPSAANKDKKQEIQQKLDAVKLKVCQKREAAIRKRSSKLAIRAENMTTRFNKIASRVEEYYTNRLVPKGVTVENYDAIVADIENKEAAVNNAVANAKMAISSFSCDADNPKGKLADYHDSMKAVIAALKEYRTSVVNLIVAVRTKGKNIKSPGASNSAQPATSSAENE